MEKVTETGLTVIYTYHKNFHYIINCNMLQILNITNLYFSRLLKLDVLAYTKTIFRACGL